MAKQATNLNHIQTSSEKLLSWGIDQVRGLNNIRL